MSEVGSTRRAVDRRGELIGSAMSVAMAVLFAGVVILGSKVQAGGPPFVTLAIRFGGQSVLLLGLAVVLRRPGLPVPGSASRSRSRARSGTARRPHSTSPP